MRSPIAQVALIVLVAGAWLAAVVAAEPAVPTCEALVAALPASLDAAHEVVVAVTLEQGGREIAFERSRIVRSDGVVTTTVLERRGLRRPDAATGGDAGGVGAFTLPCDDHDLALEESGAALLELRDPDAGAVVPRWSLRFVLIDGAWRPLELVAPFTVRVVFVPVQGRFLTTFEGWRFGAE